MYMHFQMITSSISVTFTPLGAWFRYCTNVKEKRILSDYMLNEHTYTNATDHSVKTYYIINLFK